MRLLWRGMVLLGQGLFLATGLYALPKAIWHTARGFEEQGNYFEAITEYRRLLFARPALPTELEAKIKLHIGDLYFTSGNLTAAEHWYAIPEQYEARLRQLDIDYAAGREFYPRVLELLRSGNPEQNEVERLRIEAARAFISRGQIRAAADLLSIPLPAAGLEFRRQILWDGLQNIPQGHSRWQMLWGIFPGGAYLALGNNKLAALSFFTVSTLGIVSAAAFVNGFWVSGFFAAIFAFRYYLDSLYQSFKWLNSENERIWREHREKLLGATGGPVSFTAGDSGRLQLLRSVRF